MQKPSVGRVVLYHSHGSPNGQHSPSAFPADVVAVNENGSLCLFVKTRVGTMTLDAVTEGGPGNAGTWSWPPRV